MISVRNVIRNITAVITLSPSDRSKYSCDLTLHQKSTFKAIRFLDKNIILTHLKST